MRVAIAGGGFSGTMVLCNLVRLADRPLRIDWYEPREAARGVAYGTKDSEHLLNVRADRMGAFADAPDGFFQWLKDEGIGAADAFMPRVVYARYLQSVLDAALEEARAKGIAIARHDGALNDAQDHDALVVAIGNPSPRSLSTLQDARYVDDPWNPPDGFAYPKGEEACVVIVGTGLTSVDALLSLRAAGYAGRVVALSRHGLWPAVHAAAEAYAMPGWASTPPKKALGLLRALRAEVVGKDWRGVIDSLRPTTNAIWQQLPEREQKRVMRRLFTLWNVHRHRMAPQAVAAMREMRLETIAGRFERVSAAPEGLLLEYRSHGKPGQLRADLLMNCTGPDYAASGRQGLIRGLLAQGRIAAHGLGWGYIAKDPGVWLIGSPRLGELLETTAVPELRGQAEGVARGILHV